jgi:hypothetical protein
VHNRAPVTDPQPNAFSAFQGTILRHSDRLDSRLHRKMALNQSWNGTSANSAMQRKHR